MGLLHAFEAHCAATPGGAGVAPPPDKKISSTQSGSKDRATHFLFRPNYNLFTIDSIDAPPPPRERVNNFSRRTQRKTIDHPTGVHHHPQPPTFALINHHTLWLWRRHRRRISKVRAPNYVNRTRQRWFFGFINGIKLLQPPPPPRRHYPPPHPSQQLNRFRRDFAVVGMLRVIHNTRKHFYFINIKVRGGRW